jgi:DNA-binding response OmpR family regulator
LKSATGKVIMSRPQILIVDDESSVRFVLEQTLKNQDYVLDSVGSGDEALNKLAETMYDVILLDLHMEPIDGMAVFQAARSRDAEVVVIILTAYSSVESAVEALRLGAFDYLFKPVTPDTIRQRVREGLAHRRRVQWRQQTLLQIDNLRHALNEFDAESELVDPPTTEQRFVRSGAIVIDSHHRLATMNDDLLDLTTAEFDILVCLVKAAPEPLLPRELVKCALGYETEEIEARDIAKWHIHHLRRKIEVNLAKPRCIKTVRHKGYLWSGE